MGLELVRKFIGSGWQYVAEEEGAGGGGALTVTDGVTTVPDVSTIELGGAQIISGGAGVASIGFAPGVLLQSPDHIDIHDVATHFIGWETAFDNPYDFNEISEIPPALGLDITLDGVTTLITTLAAGTWYLQLAGLLLADATWQGTLGAGFGAIAPTFDAEHEGVVFGSVIAPLPLGAELQFAVSTSEAAAADPYQSARWNAQIVRLG